MLYAIVGLIFLLADQFLKFWAVSHVELNAYPGFELIPGLLNITYIKNTGIAFGLFGGVAALRWILLVLLAAFTAFIILGLVRGYLRTGLARWSGVLLLTGLLGNGLDRAVYGFVVDMLEPHLGSISWPIFNIADCLIVIFGILFCISLLTGGFGAPRRRRAPARRRADGAVPPARTRAKTAGKPPVKRGGSSSGGQKKRRPAEGSGEHRSSEHRPSAHSTAPRRPQGASPRTEAPAPRAESAVKVDREQAAAVVRESTPSTVRPAEIVKAPEAPVQTVARPAPQSVPAPSDEAAESTQAVIRPTSETIAAQAAEAAAAVKLAEEKVKAATAENFDLDDILSEFQ